MAHNSYVFSREKFDLARARSGLSIRKLAKIARCNPASLSGKKNITLSILTAGRVAAALSVDITDLIV